MLLAKINPPVEKIYQVTAFEKTVVTGSFMSAKTQTYVIGGNTSSFEVRYGNVVFDEDQTPKEFDVLVRDTVKFTSQELSDWGTDDLVILQKIATKMGITILSTIETDFQTTY
jgi:hypothetical protein